MVRYPLDIMIGHGMFSSQTTLKFTALFMVIAACPSIAAAQDADDAPLRTYVNLAIEAVELNSFAGDSFSIFGEATTSAALRGGVIFHKNFAVEGEAAIGVDNQEGDGIADYESRFAGYGRALVPFGKTGLEAFVRLGYSVTNIDSQNVIGGDDSLDGIAYGGGVVYNFGVEDQFQVRIDYTEFNFGNSQDADAFSIGLGYNF